MTQFRINENRSVPTDFPWEKRGSCYQSLWDWEPQWTDWYKLHISFTKCIVGYKEFEPLESKKYITKGKYIKKCNKGSYHIQYRNKSQKNKAFTVRKHHTSCPRILKNWHIDCHVSVISKSTKLIESTSMGNSQHVTCSQMLRRWSVQTPAGSLASAAYRAVRVSFLKARGKQKM